MATPFGFDLSYWSLLALSWSGGIAVALMVRGFGRTPWHKALGWGILSVPVWSTGYLILDSLSILADSNSVLRPITTQRLSGITSRKLLEDLGYMLVGYLVWSLDEGSPWRRTPRSIARHLRDIGFPTGGRSEAASAWIGFVLFPLLLLVTWGLNSAASNLEALQNGDESSVWANMTPYHVVLLSLAAGFGEELFYRGFLQTALARRMHIAPAILIQALFFGFAHAGYGTWIHVLGPIGFGLVAGFVAWRFGIWAATALHVLIDVYAFGVFAVANHPWVGVALTVLLLINVLASVGAGTIKASRMMRPT